MLFRNPIIIRVDIPALDALVAYLRDQYNAQQQIDALTAQVTQVTGQLKQSGSHLNDSVHNQQS